MEEIWKTIDGYDNYDVSNLGNVKIKKTELLMSQSDRGNGYMRVSLTQNKIEKTLLVHRLVGITFLPNPDNLEFIDHIDGNKLNNNISNLRWITPSNNQRNQKKRLECSSHYVGVRFHKNKWETSIKINGKNQYIGSFTPLHI